MLLAVLFSCDTPAPPPEAPVPSTRPSEAAGRTADPALRSLLEDHWEAAMRRSPTWATALGDHRYDDQLPDASPAAVEAWQAAERGWVTRLRGLGELPGDERVTA